MRCSSSSAPLPQSLFPLSLSLHFKVDGGRAESDEKSKAVVAVREEGEREMASLLAVMRVTANASLSLKKE